MQQHWPYSGDVEKACTLWHTGFPFYSCFLLMIYRTDRLFIFFLFVCFHVCEHLFSYSSDYSVVMSSACYFLALMKLIGDSCLSKKSVWKRALLNPEPVSETAYSDIHVQKISYRQAFNKPILTADLDN